MTSVMNEDASKPEKWPFSEPQPIREDQVNNAVTFLSHPKVRGSPMVHRFSFLERKGLTREEIEEAFRRCPDPPTSEGAKASGSSEGKVPILLTQAEGVVSAPSKPASGPWSQLILGAGLIAAAGAGTGYLVQKVLAPKLRAWLRDFILETEQLKESKRERQGKGPKLDPLKEVVGAAAAAAAAAAEVACLSHLPKLQDEEWQHLRSLIKTLESRTEELKEALTKNSQDAEEHMVFAAYANTEEASSYEGAEQIQMKQGVQPANDIEMTQIDSHPTNANLHYRVKKEVELCQPPPSVKLVYLPSS
ncbi:hypothetical protein GOP47_0019639 [Adiantum capillus-veneris]|uniref:Peroxisomal membrane protein PEX14 n=1 Tax=Adiantum capillus-veneris TaxID=13818 RepID=A0A9D4Z7Z5_ADICA|nr:hypothetical protein GOP47_0019639 [Adiantum capillus-veneris]